MNHSHLHTWRAFFFIAIYLVGLLLAPMSAIAKRSSPKPVPSVIAMAVDYSAPHTLMGFVVATDIRSRKELWRKRIYRVHIDPQLERDVQAVFITSLVIEGEALVITNERGEIYILDLATRKIIKRK